MIGTSPTVHAKINGTDALFLADSGAFYSSLSPSAAAEFHLPAVRGAGQFYIEGVGGYARASVIQVDTFTIFDIPIPKVAFVVAGNGLPAGTVGVLGQNVFRIGDVEYDLANGLIRIMRPHDCSNTTLAYWAGPAGKPFSVIDIERSTPSQPHTEGTAFLNGRKIRVLFDTGAQVSLLTWSAAMRAGISPDSPGVVPGGSSSGVGREVVKTWVAPVGSFKIGDEEIRNTRLRFAETDLFANVDMLIGADFFLSHRVYVASSQKKLYFTYNGGPVFNVTTPPAAAREAASAAEAAPAAPDASPVAAGAPADARLDEPTDAAGFARRAAASSARKDYAKAIADLTRACELVPTEASYFYQRGTAHWNNHEPDLARADLDQAIKLKPDGPSALMARASLGTRLHEPEETLAALRDAADRALPKDSDDRRWLGDLYADAGQFAAAVLQYTKWIETHQRENVTMASALNSRCWARARWGKELDQALADCNSAVKLRPDTAAILDSRGLVYLRRAEFKKSIADYDAALQRDAHLAWSLYGRGVAQMRAGDTARGQADIAAATALDKNIAATAAKYGITP
jgi:tetratricopeptide (TPR) repeat protein/predicted aspartyl protease